VADSLDVVVVAGVAATVAVALSLLEAYANDEINAVTYAAHDL
jgi:hypothetical protein